MEKGTVEEASLLVDGIISEVVVEHCSGMAFSESLLLLGKRFTFLHHLFVFQLKRS